MSLGYLPPAVSDIFLPAVVARLLRGDDTALEDEICAAVGCRGAAAGSSWVLVLRELLAEIAARWPGRHEVILPSYSCNEFTKAVLLAGLRPRYVDLRRDFTCDPTAIGSAIGRETLAVFSINNIGCESDNAAIRELCDRHSIVCIEDATYTFLGTSDRDGRRFGTYGHYAVLNFSEGKIIPIGGGAVLTNVVEGIDVVENVRRRIGTRRPSSSLRELISLLIYRAGSSRLGYSAYRLLRELTGADLKQRLAMEPTRANEVGHDLARDSRGRVVLREERANSLAAETELRPLGRPKQLCGIEVIRNAARLRETRRTRHEAFWRALSRIAAVELISLPAGGMRVKAPFMIAGELTDEQRAELDRLGVARGYSTEYPTYGDGSYPVSNRFFERLFTLPIHRHISERVVRDIAEALANLSTRDTSRRDTSPQARTANEVE